MKPDSSRTPDPHQPDQPDDTSGESASTPAEGADPGAEEMIPDYPDAPDADVQNRLWLKAVVPLLQLRSHKTDPSGRAQFAFDQMYVTACERVARILRRDLPASPG